MKKISYICLTALFLCVPAFAAYDDASFQAEVREGLDLISARANLGVSEVAPGELGADVYQFAGAVQTDDSQLFIPTSLYLRMGGGINLGFATDKAKVHDKEYKSSRSWTTQIGFGFNLSSFVRTEIDLQESTLNFSGLDDAQASYRTLGGMLYFDLARRYIQNGDITYRRKFVPFIGVGAGVGQYQFDGAGGADGFLVAAPQAVLGFNIMLNNVIGIDVMYQYQMMIENGFGWWVNADSVDNISNVIVSLRANF